MRLQGNAFFSFLFVASITDEREIQILLRHVQEWSTCNYYVRCARIWFSVSLSYGQKVENRGRNRRKKNSGSWATVVNQKFRPTLPVLYVVLGKGPGLVGNSGELEVGIFATGKPMVNADG